MKFNFTIDIEDTLVGEWNGMTVTHDTHKKLITLSIARKYLKVLNPHLSRMPVGYEQNHY